MKFLFSSLLLVALVALVIAKDERSTNTEVADASVDTQEDDVGDLDDSTISDRRRKPRTRFCQVNGKKYKQGATIKKVTIQWFPKQCYETKCASRGKGRGAHVQTKRINCRACFYNRKMYKIGQDVFLPSRGPKCYKFTCTPTGMKKMPVKCSEAKWAQHQQKFRVKCRAGADCAMRKKNFEETDKMITQHNKEAKQGKHNYTVAHNFFSIMTDAERNMTRGLVFASGIPSYNKTSFIPHNETADGSRRKRATLPESVDWRNVKGVSYVTPVQYQGMCGSCWTFSATATLESHWAIKHGADQLVKLSEQNIVDCCAPPNGGGCNGGEYSQAWQYVASNSSYVLGGQSKVGDKTNTGQSLLKDYPYTSGKTQKEGSCSFKDTTSKIGLTEWTFKIAGMNPYIHVGQKHNDFLLAALAEEGPVSVAIDGGQKKFQQYSSGVFPASDCGTNLDHAVAVVGYGSKSGTGYWIIKNSWSTGWGDKGYMKLERLPGNDESLGACGLLSNPMYPYVPASCHPKLS